MMHSSDDLYRQLNRIDGRGYKAYKDIRGSYDFGSHELHLDHIQGDPFAAPSKVRLRMDMAHAGLPASLFSNRVRRIAMQDWIARHLYRLIGRIADSKRGSGKSGLISIDAGRQEVLERTAVRINEEWVEARLQVGLPASGRRVLGRQARAMLGDELCELADKGLRWVHFDQQRARQFVECVENQEAIRAQLPERDLIAFIANGAVLPRVSGADDRPLQSEVVPFQAPQALTVTVTVPDPVETENGTTSKLSGLGIPTGITLIVGGGYHGKSTLLRALERGVYPHIPGDGREYVVTRRDVVKIRAEDGRRVERVDISPFITDLPYGRSTTAFSSEDASGSTSQAANILEAIEVGACGLLLDEDTSATNFMVRDARMQALVHKDFEPITPFLDRVRELYDTFGVSTILVMGGSGDYFEVADQVLMMRDFVPHDVTAEAKKIVETYATHRQGETTQAMAANLDRIPVAGSFDASRGRRHVKIDAKGRDLILFGRDPIELRYVEQLVDISQTRAVGLAIYLATQEFMDGKTSLRAVVDRLEDFFDREGLDALDPFHRAEQHPGNFARPRKYEIAAAINRLRTVRMQKQMDKKRS